MRHIYLVFCQKITLDLEREPTEFRKIKKEKKKAC
jgi:hypothetical protein